MDERSRAWFVGVDWASRDHHAVVVDADGRKLGERGFRHGGEGLAALAGWITALTEAEPDTVAVAICSGPNSPARSSPRRAGSRRSVARKRRPAGGQASMPAALSPS